MKKSAMMTALGLVLALGAFASPASAESMSCVPVAALDIDGDGWISGDERDWARNAGFRGFDRDGNLFVSRDEMMSCLQGPSRSLNTVRTQSVALRNWDAYRSRYLDRSDIAGGYDSGYGFGQPTYREPVYGNAQAGYGYNQNQYGGTVYSQAEPTYGYRVYDNAPYSSGNSYVVGRSVSGKLTGTPQGDAVLARNGVVSRDILVAPQAGRQLGTTGDFAANQTFTALDINRDGFVSRAEWLRAHQGGSF